MKHWHIKSGQCIHAIKYKNNEFYCLDFDRTGDSIAVGCRDFKIRIFDENLKKCSQVLG